MNIRKVSQTLQLLPVDIPVKTVVQRHDLELEEVSGPAPGLHVEVLEAGQVGLVVRECDWSHVHQPQLAVVVQDLDIHFNHFINSMLTRTLAILGWTSS